MENLQRKLRRDMFAAYLSAMQKISFQVPTLCSGPR